VTASAIEGATSGLHHVTGITADVQANIDFYVGFLGA
jgi:phospholipase/carboxylesterase